MATINTAFDQASRIMWLRTEAEVLLICSYYMVGAKPSQNRCHSKTKRNIPETDTTTTQFIHALYIYNMYALQGVDELKMI